jgi:hypothetical protein
MALTFRVRPLRNFIAWANNSPSLRELMISEHVENWLGYPVKLFDPKVAKKGVEEYARVVYRLALDWDAEIGFPELFERFLDNPKVSETPAIIIGQFHGDDPETGSDEVVQLLVSAGERLPKLRGIFLADIISEENEISWIHQGDVSALFGAYPSLEHLRLRGGDGLSLGARPAHEHLKSLIIETGGLPASVIQEVASSHFPALEHLELWLGSEEYGGDAGVDDLQPFLTGGLFPNLKYLGLRDSEFADQIAGVLKISPVLNQLDTLDLSLGTLSDEGGLAILETPQLKRVKQLDLHRHYLSEDMMEKLKAMYPGVNVDDAEEDDDGHRFVAVSE